MFLVWEVKVLGTAARTASLFTLVIFMACSARCDDFPLLGTYTENQPCEGADASVARVKITAREIDSAFGLCSILDIKHEGNTYAVHVDCKGPGGTPMLGDISFTVREDKTIDFSDQDQTYKAVLYKCAE
jgi:hypothetical protein